MALASGMPPPSTSAAAQRGHTPTALNLSSNNPFRNRASPLPSPNSLNVSSSFDSRHSENRMSRNPFLDSNAVFGASNASGPAAGGSPVRDKDAVNGLTADIFGDMSLVDRISNAPPPGSQPHRAGTLPFDPMRRRPPPPGVIRRDMKPSAPVRRNSESSIMDKDRLDRRARSDRERDRDRDRGDRPPRTESEERRRQERRKEREERHRREKERGGRPRHQRGLDIIDKLDVTGVFGQGVFHHDGPFDACNPHRNVKKDRQAPMQAFPEGSMNMALGGSGPLRNRLDLDRIHGRGEEGFSDYASTRKADTTIFSATEKVDPVHGRETIGLGTSTFLEGAPASRSALQRHESAEQTAQENSGGGGGLSRKKSLVQRFRGMSNSRRDDRSGRERPAGYRSPEARYNMGSPNGVVAMESPGLPMQIRAISAGGPDRARYNRDNEINPFDNEYDAAFAKKGAQIRIAGDVRPVTPSASTPTGITRPPPPPPPPPPVPSSPKAKNNTSDTAPLARSSTNESGLVEEEKPNAGGLLSRMKSLRGGKRTRSERRGSDH